MHVYTLHIIRHVHVCVYVLKLQLRIYGAFMMITRDAFHKNTLVHSLKYSRQHFHSTLQNTSCEKYRLNIIIPK